MKKCFSLLLAVFVLSSCSDVNPSKNPDAIIHFKDQVVYGYCIKHFDLNNDGELSYKEAAAITIDDLYGEKNDPPFEDMPIKTFDELRFFTGLTFIGYSMFEDCKYLTSITIPENVESYKRACFYGCNSLNKITILSKKIPDNLGFQNLYYSIIETPAVLYVNNNCLKQYKEELSKFGFPENRIKSN